MDDKGLNSPISGPRVSSTDIEFAPDSLLEGTGIRTIGPAEGARRPRGVRLSFAPYFGWSGIRQRRLEPVLKPWSCHAEPMVRIRFPPPASQMRPIGTDWSPGYSLGSGSFAATGRRPRLGPCGPLQRAALAGSGAIYSMTRSASSSNEFGICMPICCAACRLITSSKRVGSSTGRVAGSAPLAILST